MTTQTQQALGGAIGQSVSMCEGIKHLDRFSPAWVRILGGVGDAHTTQNPHINTAARLIQSNG